MSNYSPRRVDPATDPKALVIDAVLRHLIEAVHYARRAISHTRVSDDTVTVQTALDDAQRILEQALPARTE
jgi:hypothetical protein